MKINLRRYIEIEESLLSSLMNKAGLADITYARQLVERMCQIDMDTVNVARHIEGFPDNAEAMLTARLDDLVGRCRLTLSNPCRNRLKLST